MTGLAPVERAGPNRPAPLRSIRTWRSWEWLLCRCVVVSCTTHSESNEICSSMRPPMKDRWARDIHTISLMVWGSAILAASSELAGPGPLRSIDRDTTNNLRTWSKLGVVVVPLRLRVAFSLLVAADIFGPESHLARKLGEYVATCPTSPFQLDATLTDFVSRYDMPAPAATPADLHGELAR